MCVVVVGLGLCVAAGLDVGVADVQVASQLVLMSNRQCRDLKEKSQVIVHSAKAQAQWTRVTSAEAR
jgi:hypothetical protein